MNAQHPLTQAVIAGRRKEVPDLVNRCLDAGESPISILEFPRHLGGARRIGVA